MAGINEYDTTAGNNSSINSIDISEGCAPSGINNALRQIMADNRSQWNDANWFEYGDGAGTVTISYQSATSFSVDGIDVSSIYHVGRRVRAVGSSTGTIYGRITAVSFATNTTVTVDWDSGSLSNEALVISLSILGATNSGIPEITYPDDHKIKLGTGSDLEIYHDGSNSYIDDTGTGNLNITGSQINLDSAQINLQDGSSNNVLTVNSSNIDIPQDNIALRLGASNDLKIVHNGSNSIIQDTGTGDLYLAGDNNVAITNSGLSEFKALFGTNSASILYYDNTQRISTRSNGGAIIGNLNIDGSAANATARLDVTGSDTINGTANVAARFGVSGIYVQLGAKNGNTPFVAAPSGSNLILQTNNTRRVLIEDSTGDVTIDNDLSVSGSLSKGSGSFKINHPLPSKTNTHHLVHSFIEGPQADNIYRGKINLVNGSATINLDTEFGMTEGTFVALNREIQCFTSNETDWDNVKGSVNGNTLTINCQNTSSTATISWMVIGERKDQHMMDAKWTDSQGKVILEPEIIPDPE